MAKALPIISDEIFIGRIHSAPRKVLRVSHLVSENKRYCSVLEEYQRFGNDEWFKGKGRWYPYEELEELLVLLHRAQAEAKKRNWGDGVPSQLDMGEEPPSQLKKPHDDINGGITEGNL